MLSNKITVGRLNSLLALSLFLSACNARASLGQTPTFDLTAVYTQVAGTLAAQGILQSGSSTPTSGVISTEASPTQTSTAMPGLLLTDDFSNLMSGWEIRNESSAVTDYRDGVFVIVVNKPDTSLWSKPIGVFTDVDISVDALQVAGASKNLFGIICRYQDPDNFYRLVIGADGFAGITKRSNGEVTVISGALLTVSNAVNQGLAANHIEAICQGSHLTLLVNGETVAEATDDQFASGEIGLIASSGKGIGVEVHFDNFVVREP
jgi:hypothetical protein